MFEKGPFLPGAIGEMVEPILPAVVQAWTEPGTCWTMRCVRHPQCCCMPEKRRTYYGERRLNRTPEGVGHATTWITAKSILLRGHDR